MSAGQGIEAGKAFVEFVLSDKKLDKGLARIGRKLKSVGSLGLAATAPILAGFAAAAATFAKAGDELGKLSARTGVPVERLGELAYAADLSDATLDDLEKGMRELQSRGIDPLKFDEVAADITSIKDPTKQAQKAIEYFGKRTGTALLPMLKDLPALKKKFHELGLEVSTKDTDAATALGDAFQDTKLQLRAMAFQIGAAVAGPLTDFLKAATPILKWVIDFTKEHKTLVTAIAAITFTVGTLSAGMIALGFAVGGVQKAFYGAAVAAKAFNAATAAGTLGKLGAVAGGIGAAIGGAYVWKRTLSDQDKGSAAIRDTLTRAIPGGRSIGQGLQNLLGGLSSGSVGMNLQPAAARAVTSLRDRNEATLPELREQTALLNRLVNKKGGMTVGWD